MSAQKISKQDSTIFSSHHQWENLMDDKAFIAVFLADVFGGVYCETTLVWWKIEQTKIH